MGRYFGPGFTGTVETIYRLAKARNPRRWDGNSIPEEERKVWDDVMNGLSDGWRKLNHDLFQTLKLEMPEPDGTDWPERYCDVMEACTAIRTALEAGSLIANCRADGTEYPVPTNFWGGNDETVITALLSGGIELKPPSEPARPFLIRLRQVDLDRIWPELSAQRLPVNAITEEPPHLSESQAPNLRLTKPEAAAHFFRQKYPAGRPSMNAKELEAELAAGAPGIGKISARTLARSFTLAWATAAPKHAK